jgi:hypothetical protein
MLGWNYLLFEALKGFSVGICDGRFIYGKIFFLTIQILLLFFVLRLP